MPPRLVEVTDVTVVGGGPAGAASAIRLAQLGHRVVLVERAERGRPHVGESLPPTVLPLLQTLGVGERVEAARFLRPRGAIVQWDGVLRDVRDDARDEPGFQVDRGRFDALLLHALVHAIATSKVTVVLRIRGGYVRPGIPGTRGRYDPPA